jgi:phosphatidylglycerol:prolipoprotein diacylglycerol transferase
LGYGLARSICEHFREPDQQLGFLWNSVTMGTLLSVPLIVAGLVIIAAVLRAKPLRDKPLREKPAQETRAEP